MKKHTALLLSIVLLAAVVLAGCGGGERGDKTTAVATVYPIYDWMKALTVGTDIEVKLLIDGGSDVHSYQPSVSDIAAISNADLFVYVGGESEAWVKNAVKNTDNPSRTDLCLLSEPGITLYNEELTEGMQGENEDEEDGPEIDEHIWLSLRAAAVCAERIKDALIGISPGNAETIRKNAEEYVKQINDLSEKQRAEAAEHAGKTMIFADRFPFRYLAEDYGFNYFAPFPGCSAETEASFETVAFLTEKVKSLGAENVFVLSENNGRLAGTIAPDAGVLTLVSLETRCEKSYLEAMSDNFQTILKGLY